MKYFPSILVAAFSSSAVSHASEPPVEVGASIFVEEAWARVADDGTAEVYLVVNNRNPSSAATLDIEVVGAASTEILDARNQSIEPTVPSHSELYMFPDGVRILATGVVAASAVRVRVAVDAGEPLVIDAKGMADGVPVPDHHDYVHD